MSQMIIANRLLDGLVVFWAGEAPWVESIDDGTLLEANAEEALARAKQDEDRCLVVDPNLIEVEVEEGRRKPTAMREAIRAFGPSVRTDLREAS
jgi:hypothetical protein